MSVAKHAPRVSTNPAPLLGCRAAALSEAIVGYLDSQTPKVADLGLLQTLFRPGYGRRDVTRAIDALANNGRVKFTPNDVRVAVVLCERKAGAR